MENFLLFFCHRDVCVTNVMFGVYGQFAGESFHRDRRIDHLTNPAKRPDIFRYTDRLRFDNIYDLTGGTLS